MKKRVKKLSLSRETLRHLERAQLGNVAGGSETHEIQTGCACTDTCASNCDTCVGCGGGSGSCISVVIIPSDCAAPC